MPVRNRLIEVIYALKDRFSGQVGKITGAYGRIRGVAARTSKDVEKSTKEIGISFGSVGKILTGIFTGGAFTAAGVTLKRYVDEIDALAKTARKLGTTTEALSKLGYAAELTGVQTSTLQVALQRMTRRIAEAAQGGGEAKDAIKELGLDAAELAKLPVDEQFKRIADAFENVTVQGDRVRLGFKLFDAEAVGIINTLEGGREALEAYGEELERLGGVIDQEAAESAERLNDSITRFNLQLEAFTNRYGPAFIDTAEEAFRFWGFGQRVLDDVLQDIAELKTRRDELENGRVSLYDALFGPTQAERYAEIERINRELEKLAEERTTFIKREHRKRNTERAAELGDLKDNAKKTKAQLKEETSALKRELTIRERAYKDHNRQLEVIRKEQAAIHKEFTGLADELRSDQAPDTAPDLRAVQDIRAQAGQQLAAGEFDAAIESARKAGELLKEIKEEGGESNIVLAGLAGLLRQLAEEAARGKEAAQIVDVEASKKEVDELKTKIAAVKAEAEQNTVKVKLEVDSSDFQAQVQQAVAEAQAAAGPVTVRAGNVFSDGTADFDQVLDEEVLARGNNG